MKCALLECSLLSDQSEEPRVHSVSRHNTLLTRTIALSQVLRVRAVGRQAVLLHHGCGAPDLALPGVALPAQRGRRGAGLPLPHVHAAQGQATLLGLFIVMAPGPSASPRLRSGPASASSLIPRQRFLSYPSPAPPLRPPPAHRSGPRQRTAPEGGPSLACRDEWHPALRPVPAPTP